MKPRFAQEQLLFELKLFVQHRGLLVGNKLLKSSFQMNWVQPKNGQKALILVGKSYTIENFPQQLVKLRNQAIRLRALASKTEPDMLSVNYPEPF